VPGSRPCGGQDGFAYMLMLAFVTISGFGLTALAHYWSSAGQREREAELLFAGHQFRAAIASYYDQSPGAKQFPRSLDELLEDQRFPTPKRHLRRMYLDPMTGTREWGLVRYEQWIVGVHSTSEARPFKAAWFDVQDAAFTGSERYADWRFVHTPTGFQSAALAALRGAQEAAPPPMPLSGEVVLQSVPAPAPAKLDRSRPRLATEPWVCTATLGTELRNCRPGAGPQAALEACKQAAHARSKACLGRAVAASDAATGGKTD
jgi:type II secretory pathway pseudopilin PulG